MQTCFLNFLKYDEYLEWLKRAQEQKLGEMVIITKHDACITLGSTSSQSEILEKTNLPVYLSNRGGGATYHDSGQLVLYPRIALKKRLLNITEYIHLLEQWAIDALDQVGIEAFGQTQPGLWIRPNEADERSGRDEEKSAHKVAFIGLAIRNGFTEHGIAFNLHSCNLSNFDKIIPCKTRQKIVKLNLEFDLLANALIKTCPFA